MVLGQNEGQKRPQYPVQAHGLVFAFCQRSRLALPHEKAPSIMPNLTAPQAIALIDASLPDGQTLAIPTAREVVFIEDNLTDWNILSTRLAASAEVVVLDSSGDGLAQMATYLASRQPASLDAIHVLSHGAVGQLNLGSTSLTQDTLGQYTTAFNTIGQVLSEQGDLLLYGCDVGASEAG